MGGYIAASCQGEGCKGLKERDRGKALCIVGFSKKEICPKCLIASPDFDMKGEIKP